MSNFQSLLRGSSIFRWLLKSGMQLVALILVFAIISRLVLVKTGDPMIAWSGKRAARKDAAPTPSPMVQTPPSQAAVAPIVVEPPVLTVVQSTPAAAAAVDSTPAPAKDVADKLYIELPCEQKSLHFAIKAAFDRISALLLIVLLLPMLLLIAAAISIESKGGPFFIQKRVGTRRVFKDGQWVWVSHTFMMYKFRSMYKNSPTKLHEEFVKAFMANDKERMSALNGGSDVFKLQQDPRVTKVGRILRKTSLDELPQLINVLLGEMSLVGPRPALPYEVEVYEEWHKKRLAGVPGITGYWQAVGRSEVEFDKMVELDIYYARHQSFWLDMKILALTPMSVLRGKGAA